MKKDWKAEAEWRFWSMVNVGRMDDCWEWQGAKHNGYGMIASTYHGVKSAHRMSWVLHQGSIPAGLNVLHACDNPGCVNPAHLFLGTDKDNMVDMASKGRNRTAIGSESVHARLTESDIPVIFKLSRAGMSNPQIGERYGVSGTCIFHIIHRHKWKHVQIDENE